MYYLLILLLMLIFPVASIVAELIFCRTPNLVFVSFKWFVFWAIGIRIIIAGIRQIVQPKFTSEIILRIKDPQSWILVRELGFSNVAIGVICLLSLFIHGWIIPGALSGSIFMGLAGINHIFQRNKNGHEVIAMISDIFISIVIIALIILFLIK